MFCNYKIFFFEKKVFMDLFFYFFRLSVVVVVSRRCVVSVFLGCIGILIFVFCVGFWESSSGDC